MKTSIISPLFNLILISLAMLFMNSCVPESSNQSCPENATYNSLAESCFCNFGFERNSNDECVEIVCGENFELSQEGECICMEGFVVNTDGECVEDGDRDKDGIFDGQDNCPDTFNPGQENLDGDVFGDVCDVDVDGDGVLDEFDNCPRTPNADQSDIDGDGLGDVCDPDIDNDGLLNEQDNCPNKSNPDQTDQDGDGIGDICDDDIDGDGVINTLDNCPFIPNPDQVDSDGDGFGDVCGSNVLAGTYTAIEVCTHSKNTSYTITIQPTGVDRQYAVTNIFRSGETVLFMRHPSAPFGGFTGPNGTGEPQINGRFFTGRMDWTEGNFDELILNYTFYQDPSDNCTANLTRQ